MTRPNRRKREPSASTEPPDAAPTRVGTFAALRERDFCVLWFGSWTSYVGFFMSTIVNSVVAYELTGTNRSVGTVVFAQGLSMVVLAPIGGACADRWPRRRVLALTQTASAAVFGTITILLATQTLQIVELAAGSFVMGICLAFLGPARQAMAADLVPIPIRGNAVALNQVALTGSQVLGPAIAGALLISQAGATGAYAIMAGLYTLAALSLIFLPRSSVRPDAGRTHVFADLAAGLRYVWSYPRLRLLVLFFVTVIMAGFPYVTVLPGLVQNELGHASDAISLLYFVSAVGGLGASLMAARLADTRLALPVFVSMSLLFGLSILALSFVPSYAAAAGVIFFVGMGVGGFQSLNGAVIVRTAEPAYFGRVISLTMIAFAGFGLLGLPIGLLADAIGERGALVTMSACVCATATIVSILLYRRQGTGPPSLTPAEATRR